MAMSTHIRCWMSIDVSGDRKCADPALKLYYPRDISALRGAY